MWNIKGKQETEEETARSNSRIRCDQNPPSKLYDLLFSFFFAANKTTDWLAFLARCFANCNSVAALCFHHIFTENENFCSASTSSFPASSPSTLFSSLFLCFPCFLLCLRGGAREIGDIFRATVNTREIKVATHLLPFSFPFFFPDAFPLFRKRGLRDSNVPAWRKFMTGDARRKYARTTFSEVFFSLFLSAVHRAPQRNNFGMLGGVARPFLTMLHVGIYVRLASCFLLFLITAFYNLTRGTSSSFVRVSQPESFA